MLSGVLIPPIDPAEESPPEANAVELFCVGCLGLGSAGGCSAGFSVLEVSVLWAIDVALKHSNAAATKSALMMHRVEQKVVA
jgi:hypothetical protein